MLKPLVRAFATAWVRPPLFGSGRDYARFVILSNHRSGSTMLVSALASHPRVVCFSEVFNRPTPMFFAPGYPEGSRLLARFRQDDPREFLDRVVFSRYRATILAVGFKAFPRQIQDPRFAAVLRELVASLDTRLVCLVRRNKLAQYLSLVRAERTGVWSSNDFKADDQTPIRLEPSACRHALDRLSAKDRFLQGLVEARPGLDLTYEDLVRDPTRTYERVQRHLGLPIEPLRPTMRKQRTLRLSESIANYDELKATFAGSEAATFFDPDEAALC